jgi:hypothetical protein
METSATRQCDHGLKPDDWCIRCVADDMIERHADGASYSAIARALGYHRSTVKTWIGIREYELRSGNPVMWKA